MQLLSPTFAYQFKCVADKCSYSCCRDWSIFFNETELMKFKQYGINDIDTLSRQLEPGKYEMKCNSNGKCPYLEESGLCRMITTCDNDEVLCNTCQTFPRIIKPRKDYIEYTLSNACPAVIDILNNTPSPITFELIDYDDSIKTTGCFSHNLISCRDTMVDLMQISDFPIWMRLYIIYSFATKVKKLDGSNFDSIIMQYNSVDYLIEMYQQLLSFNINIPTKLQLLTDYLAISHDKKSTKSHEVVYAKLYKNVLKYDIDYLSEKFLQYEEVFSKHSSLMENIAVNDLFRNINCENQNDMYYSAILLIIMMSLIKFTSFLKWLDSDNNNCDTLDYNIIVYFARRFEHISFTNLKKQAIEFEKNKLLDPGNIFTLIR